VTTDDGQVKNSSCPASLSVDRTYVAIEPRIVGVLCSSSTEDGNDDETVKVISTLAEANVAQAYWKRLQRGLSASY
jgi:hypothetical protein